MTKTVNDFIKELQVLKPSLRNMPVVVIAPNGEQFEATAKIGFKYPGSFEIKNVVITY